MFYHVGKLPTYSRALSDPVAGGVELSKTHRVVIVEGNYMLNYDDNLWAPLKDLFDEKVTKECDHEILFKVLNSAHCHPFLFYLYFSGTYRANLWTFSGTDL